MKFCSLLALPYLLLPSFAFAKQHGCTRPVELREILSDSKTFTSATCEVKLPLALVHGPHNFSFGTYMTDCWQGIYKRSAERTKLVRYIKYDYWGSIVDSKIVIEKDPLEVIFELVNLNLTDRATWADIKAPMTDDEAIANFSKTKIDCESFVLK